MVWYVKLDLTKNSLKICHKSTLAVPKYLPQISVTFKIKNLATCDCVKDSGKAASRQGWGREAPDRARAGNTKILW